MGGATSSELKNNYVDKPTFQHFQDDIQRQHGNISTFASKNFLYKSEFQQFQNNLPNQYASLSDVSQIQNNISTLQHDLTPYVIRGGAVCFNSGDVPLCFTPINSPYTPSDNILKEKTFTVYDPDSKSPDIMQIIRLSPTLI